MPADLPDGALEAVLDELADTGLELYPHQEEAILELATGAHVVLATPTGSGKSLVAEAGIRLTLADGGTAYYTAPIKALVSEKFFALCDALGPERVGMVTGDATVNGDAPVICCTAEILANLALREGADAAIDLVVSDEFHYYDDADRGWAWQVPLLELTRTRFLLMSATLGDPTHITEPLAERTGRPVTLVDTAERPVPLDFRWSTDQLVDVIDEIVGTGQAPAYLVHFTQADAVEQATALANLAPITQALSDENKRHIAEVCSGFGFRAGFGKTLSRLLRRGVGVHHAGMLPKYRRLVERLAQGGHLTVVCGTDTLGVGINVPIRTVLFTGLAKYDGRRQRVLSNREFQQIAGRAGRAGFDTVGYVVVQAPAHAIENAKALAKAGDDAKKRRKVHLKKPADGEVVWTEETYERLVGATSEQMRSRMRISDATVVNALGRHDDVVMVLRRLIESSGEPRARQLELASSAVQRLRSMRDAHVVQRLDVPDEHGRRYVLAPELRDDFALNQPLAQFARAAVEVIDPEAEPMDYALDVVSAFEAVLDPPRVVLFAQQRREKGEVIAALKADGVEYDERMAIADEVSWPEPLADLLVPLFETYRTTHPWLSPDSLTPKSVVRHMFERGQTFAEFVAEFGLARSEGVVLRYLSDAFRLLRTTVPESVRSPEVDLVVEWLGLVIRSTDSSLVTEWERLIDPDHAEPTEPEPTSPLRLSDRPQVLERMVRNAMFGIITDIARDRFTSLAERDARSETVAGVTAPMDRDAWDAALEDYYDEHDRVRTDSEARGPSLFVLDRSGPEPGVWHAFQTVLDPEDHRDWVVRAELDVAATDESGDLALVCAEFRRFEELDYRPT